MRSVNRWSLLVIAGGLLACSNEDPPEAGDADAATGADASGGTDADPESFYPLVDGASWSYSHTGGDVPWNEEVTLTTTSYDGEDAFLLQDTPGPSGVDSDDVLRQVGTAVLRVHKDETLDGALQTSVDYDPGFARFDYAWVEQAEGYEETLTYQRTAHDGQGVLMSDAPREHVFTVEAFGERVTVPAGSFEDCIEIHRARVRAPGEVPLEGDLKRFWFCPGIGKTKELDLVSGKLEELTACDVPGGDCP